MRIDQARARHRVSCIQKVYEHYRMRDFVHKSRELYFIVRKQSVLSRKFINDTGHKIQSTTMENVRSLTIYKRYI